MNANLVKFRYGTPVTSSSPSLIPGSFVFDSASLALYLDTDSVRVQVMDPLKLALTGGTLTGTLSVVNNQGTTVCRLNSSTGVVQGTFLETTGEIALDHAPGLYAVIENGRIYTRTAAQMKSDLGIADVSSLGDLAYADTASGTVVPSGTVSTPTVTVNTSTESVVKEVTPGTLPEFGTTVVNDTLSFSFNAGTAVSSTSTNVLKGVTSVDVTQPTFTGSTTTIQVTPDV